MGERNERIPLLSPSHRSTPSYDSPSLITITPIATSTSPSTACIILSSDEEDHVMTQMKVIFKLTWPVILTFMGEILPTLVSSAFVGHLGSPLYFSAASVATMFFNISALSILFGFTSGLDTLCSQASGAQNYLLIGLWLQRALVIVLVLISAISLPILLSAKTILIWLGQPADISTLAQSYLYCLLPALPFLTIYDCGRKALQAQGIVRPMLVISLITNIINAACCYLLIHVLNMSLYGAAIASSISYACMPLCLFIYASTNQHTRSCWPGWSIHAICSMNAIVVYLTLSIPSMFFSCLEWWAFELLLLIAGHLPDAPYSIAAHSILIMTTQTTYSVYFSMGIAVNIMVGNLLGSGRPVTARSSALLTLFLGLLSACFCSSLYFILRGTLAHIFTSDARIIQHVYDVTILAGTYQFVDATNAINSGIIRGVGKQLYGALFNLTAYYCVGLPLAYYLALYRDLGLYGCWMGMIIAVSVAATMSSIYVIQLLDWTRESQSAQERAAELVETQKSWKNGAGGFIAVG